MSCVVFSKTPTIPVIPDFLRDSTVKMAVEQNDPENSFKVGVYLLSFPYLTKDRDGCIYSSEALP